MKLEAVNLRGTRALQPAPTAVPIGSIYCVSDEENILERSTGPAWEPFSPSAALGDVLGPPVAGDTAVARFDGTTGELLQNSPVTISDAGALGLPAGVRQAFAPNATTPGLNVGAVAGDPSSPSDGDIWYNATTNQLRTQVNGAAVSLGAPPSGNLIGVRVFTTPGAGTYTPTAGTGSVVVELVGAGGGGGACISPAGSSIATGSGGGGGAWLLVRLVANFSGASYSVGAKGAGGAAGANVGANGAATTFTTTGGSPVVYSAGGGSGGSAGSGAATPPSVGQQAAGGVASNGLLQRDGSPSSPAISMSASNHLTGAGGGGPYGQGGASVRWNVANTSNPGAAGTGKGSGGSGAGAGGTGTARAGGDGTDGVLIVWEYGA